MGSSQNHHASGNTAIVVRSCSSPEEFQRCVEVEEAVWHFDPLDAVSHHILRVPRITAVGAVALTVPRNKQ